MPTKKERTLLMFRDRRTKISNWSGLLGFFFGLFFVLAIIAGIAFLAALVIWPILFLLLVVCTLGIVLAFGGMDWGVPGEFTQFMIIAIAFLAGGALVFWVLRYLVEWLAILNETHWLKKHPEEYKHQIIIAGVVRRVRLFDSIICVFVVALLIVTIATAHVFLGNDSANAGFWDKAVPIISLVGIFILLGISGVHAQKQFETIHDSMKAAYQMRYNIAAGPVGGFQSMPASISLADLDPKAAKPTADNPKPDTPQPSNLPNLTDQSAPS